MTSHPWRLATVFAICLSIALAAAGWLTVLVFRLDEGQLEARHSADVEGRVRLALWRMDSAVAPLVAQENARPYFVLEPFYSLEAATSLDLANSTSLVPSPLLAEAGHDVLLHFQVRNDGTLTSPQVPTGPLRELAVDRYVSPTNLSAAEQRLRELASWIQVPRLLAELPPGERGAPSAAGTALVVKHAPRKAEPAADGGAEYRRRLLVVNQNVASQQLLQTQLNPPSLGTNSWEAPPTASPLAPSDAAFGLPRPFPASNLLDTLTFSPSNGAAQLQMACTRPLDIVGDPTPLVAGGPANGPLPPTLMFGTTVATPWTANVLEESSASAASTRQGWLLACSLPTPDRSALVSTLADVGPFTSSLLRAGSQFVNRATFDHSAGGVMLDLSGNLIGPNLLTSGFGANAVSAAASGSGENGSTGNAFLVNGGTLVVSSTVPNALASNLNIAGVATNDLTGTSNTLTLTANVDGTTTLSGANTYTGSTTITGGTLLQLSGANDNQGQTVNWAQNETSNYSVGNGRQLQPRAAPSLTQNRFTNVSPGNAAQREPPVRQQAEAATRNKPADPAQAIVTTSMMTPVWIGDHLLLARRVSTGRSEYVQGCWLDWPAIQKELKALADDLLPGLELEAVRAPLGVESERMLATLPVRLLPGKLPLAEVAHSPLRLSLLPAWIGIVLAAIASAVLLAGILALSERRAAFVSAVTHELRTPLTTFRMYAEMLAEGMVPDEARRREYLDTLRGEADRLAHLVENVLAYARLERTGVRTRGEQQTLGALVERATARLRTRSAQAGLELTVELDPAAADALLWIDASAVEQVLFNLVDNACKYAQSASDRRLVLAVDTLRNRARIRLRDYGAGIDRAQARQLFRPFSKTDREAAQTAPGVGLGLALSRRLARTMGGDLELAPSAGPGAEFVLTLPLESPRGR